MQMKSFLREFNLSRTDVENWLRRVPLRTNYAHVIPPKPREFSRLNVLELAMIGRTVDRRFRPDTGAALAEVVIDQYRVRKLKRWMFVADNGSGGSSDYLDPDLITEICAKSESKSVVIFDVKDIADRVDSLFNKAEAE